MRRAVRVRLTELEARQLHTWAAATGAATERRAIRAKIVLMAADGFTNQAIGGALHLHPETVGLWRRRFVSNRLEGIRMDAPRSSPRKRSVKLRARIVHAAQHAQTAYGTPWTTRALAKRFRVSHMTVYRAWHSRLHQDVSIGAGGVASPAAPVAEPLEMQGVFLHPPRRAAVFQIGGDPSPSMPTGEGLPAGAGRAAHGSTGRGLSVLFHQWKRSAACRHGSLCSVAELLVFLRMVERREPTAASFMVLYEGFSRAAEARVVRWTRAHHRFHPVRVPAGTTWFKAVERYLTETPSKAPVVSPWEAVLRPLTESLASYLQTNPAAPAPFVWTPPSPHPGISGPSGPSAPD